MKASLKKRILSYFFDIILVGIILSLIYMAFPKSKNEKIILEKQDQLVSQYIDNDISFSTYLNQYSGYQYDLMKENRKNTIIDFLILILYFIVFPTFLNGQTFGMIINKIKIKDPYQKQIKVSKLVVRSIVIYGVGYLFLVLLCQLFVPRSIYFYAISILGIIQLILVILSGFMIRYKKEKLAFQDKITKTEVIEVKHETI